MKVATKDLHRILYNALLFASKDEFRPTLRAVKLSANRRNARLTATAMNSYVLGEDSCNAVDVRREEEGLLAARDARTLVRLCRETRCKEVRVVFGTGVITFRFERSSHSFGKQAGAYPEYEKLWPKKFEDAPPSLNLNPVYFSLFGKVRPRGINSTMVFKSSGQDKIILVTLAGADESFRGLLMPVRMS